ncbi:small, acid-soluble spore protein tlp [Bacillus sp. FJAT-22090]|uniref:small, acid-soluble spore protein tlp n=1 Tax=Bacillus sp. FJAT-22090 TaxID=1581038 RepID=UPI00119D7200|nr:small, acid-soluble spore protein tlp [Bacillus sp. FJAT-22090]
MERNSPGSNDPANRKERLKKTIENKKAAEAAMEFADGKELAAIKEKNARREENIEDMKNDLEAQSESIKGYV